MYNTIYSLGIGKVIIGNHISSAGIKFPIGNLPKQGIYVYNNMDYVKPAKNEGIQNMEE